MSDHPHARGENTNATQSCTLTSGPSPRTWGEPWPGIPSRPPSRTIPTHVGRTAEIFSQPDRASDHPHARGENMARFGNRSALPGPSPRTWGERRDSRSRWSRNSDHPHARGENPLIMASAAVNCGPSPRTWGEHGQIWEQVCACIFASPLISGVKQSLELAVSGGGGRSALRPGGNSRACRVDRPPALFSHAEENPRPYEPAYSSSTGDGTGSGGPDRKLNSRRVL